MTGEDHRRRRGADEEGDPSSKGLLDDLPETGRGSGSGSGAAPPSSGRRPAQQRPNPFTTPEDRRHGGGGGPRSGRSEQPNVIPFRGGGHERAGDERTAEPAQARHEQPGESREADEGGEMGEGERSTARQGAAPEPEPSRRPQPERWARRLSELAKPTAPGQTGSSPRETEPTHGGRHEPDPESAPGPRETAEPAAEPVPYRTPGNRPEHEPAHARADERADAPRTRARPAPMAPQYPPPSRTAPSAPVAPPTRSTGGSAAPGPDPADGASTGGAAPPPAHDARASSGAAPGPPTPSEDESPVNAHAAASFPEHSDDPADQSGGDHRSRAGDQPREPEEPAHAAEPGEHAYADAEREAVYRAIRERRDVRMGFRADPIPDPVLRRVLDAAHRAPSVGYSQPWDFILVQDEDVRDRVQKLVQEQREAYARALPGARARAFSGLKVEAILDTPVNIVVTVDPTRGGRHTLGRHSQPQTASYSTALAVENLWLAARSEGLGVGWVSFFEERELAQSLDLPPHLEVVAYLCVGYVEDFPPEPELAMGGWARGRPLHWAVHRDHYGRRGLPGEKATSLLEETIAAIGPLNQRAVNEAEERQAAMTKPPGSLGVLEEVSVRLSGLVGECPPPIPEPAAVAIFAGDHGVHAQGVSGWPQDVTAQMVHNFLADGAVVNAFAEQVGAEVTIVDVGVAADLPTVPGLLPRKIARGTADFTRGPAMSRTQVDYAVEAGIEVARDLVSAGNRCLVTGDMGIANTTPSAALISAFTGTDPADVTGRGTGVDDAMLEHKIDVVRRGLAANADAVDPADPVGVLAAVGGLEHAALSGFILGAAALRVPVLLDGVIAGAAALAAAAMEPLCLNACFAGHRSTEPGHAAVLSHIGLRPLVDLEMRLGEGSGALLALPILQGSVRALRNVATFDSAGVSERG
ncbi:nicotinate-nucleotide--dimethylbenzimidazole phosphoribosyltransferase [Streptomonospora litoralis]|uniref:Nicotinate-nucleotide--dimethylbenzimidazole phosphoribosyltransferase n=1 Tax=Streptomonospora litoralis TaxID=2498135 RepID=A0A4P6Q7H6_9ACTN|nr:nicotinate-nucleotide--dimethylbenzimidazole phosphoribosyltransferase [Streptomonospora litoralis]QBI55391.1 Nicotinate-nucleotide--dimethylbenzimidazole phosphoribosyltransferase [Streptomonospora litoralis]